MIKIPSMYLHSRAPRLCIETKSSLPMRRSNNLKSALHERANFGYNHLRQLAKMKECNIISHCTKSESIPLGHRLGLMDM